MADATAWAEANAAGLEGEDAETAASRVREAGLTPRIAPPQSVLTLEFRTDRITLQTDARGVVTAARAG